MIKSVYKKRIQTRKKERKKERKRWGRVSFRGRARIGSFYQFELESTGHPKISKGERSPRLSFPFTRGENTRGIIVPSDPISRRDNSFPLNPRTSSYRGMKVTGHCNYLAPLLSFFFLYPHKSNPLLPHPPPSCKNFSLPRVFKRFHSRVVKERYGEYEECKIERRGIYIRIVDRLINFRED